MRPGCCAGSTSRSTRTPRCTRWCAGSSAAGWTSTSAKAFLFNNITDSLGRHYDIPVVIGALAANKAVYSTGMRAEVADIPGRWDHALANPVPPRLVNQGSCQEVVIEGAALQAEGNGLDALPIPISTPGFDSAPTLAATNVITKDPETGVQNMGTYRAGLKAPDRLVVRMATRVGGAGGYIHWKKHKALGEELPCAIVLGCPPLVAFMGPQKLKIDLDEFAVAGGLAGEPINVVRAKTVDLLVPAEAEVVIEGMIDTTYLEPEGPFGESHGHVALEEYNLPMRVTAITRKARPVIPSYISQVAPSESSVIKRVAYEPLFLAHLRDQLGIKAVTAVALHEKLTGLLRVTIVTLERGAPRTEIWRALYGVAGFKADCFEDLHRGQRRHRSRQCRCAALGAGLPPQSGPGHRGPAPSRPGPRAQARARGRGGFHALDRCYDEVAHAAAGPAGAAVYGRRARLVGAARPAQAQAGIALARLQPGRLDRGLGPGRQTRRGRALSGQRSAHPPAPATRSGTGNIGARHRRQGRLTWSARPEARNVGKCRTG